MIMRMKKNINGDDNQKNFIKENNIPGKNNCISCLNRKIKSLECKTKRDAILKRQRI